MTLVAASTSPAAPAVVRAASLPDSIKVEPLTCSDRRGAEQRRPRRRLARRATGRRDPRAAAQAPRAVLPRPGHHPRRARRLRAPLRRAGGPPGGRQRPGEPRASCASTSRPTSPTDRYENAWHTDATWREKPPFGCVLRCVECPPVGGDTMWANMALAYENLPEHVKDADRRPARPPQHRGQLRRRDADREAPGAEGAVPRRRAPGGAHASRRPARRSCSSTPSPPTSRTSTRRSNVRFGQDYAPGALAAAAAT